jgi:hypothetical protein
VKVYELGQRWIVMAYTLRRSLGPYMVSDSLIDEMIVYIPDYKSDDDLS